MFGACLGFVHRTGSIKLDKKGYSQGVFRFLSAKGKEWLLGEFGPVKPSPESGGLQLTREGFVEQGLL